MGLSNAPSHTHKFFLLTNYILIGAATSCIFLTLSLRLLPSVVGLLLIFLHLLTIILSISSCSSVSSSALQSAKWHALHMAATVLIAIFQGAVALLVFSKTEDFLGKMKSYVREDDGAVILKMVGGLGVVTFALEWAALVLAFVMRFYVYAQGSGGARVRQEEEVVRKDWLPFQV